MANHVTHHLTSVVIAGLMLLPAAAAAQDREDQPSRTSARTTSVRWTEQDYRLGSGDKLRVEVYRQDQLSQSLQIRPDGKITLPLVGDVHAAGKTSLELRDALTESLKEYVTNPVVTVIVQEAVSAQVHVIGDVASPGSQVMNGSLTVLQALAKAGGPGEFADKNNIRVLRMNGTKTDVIPFNYKRALRGETQPIYLQPGDTIVVP